MNFIIRHLETLGDEVAAALDELADEVVGHRQTSRDRRSRTPELSDGESSSVAEPHAASSVGVPTTDDDSATDNDTSPAPLPMSSPPPNRPPMSSPGGSSSAATAAAISRVPCVKRRPLVATRIQPPVNSDPRLNEGQRPSASLQPAPIPTAVQQQYQQSSQQQQPDSPPCSPAKWMPDRAAGTTRSPVPERSTSPCLDDIGAPYVERPSQVHLMASATPAVPPPTTTQTRAQQSPEQQKTQPPSSKRKTVEEAKTTPPSTSVGRTASSEPTPQPKLAPAPPVVQSRGPSVAPAKPPTVKPASSDFDLCDRLDSPNVPAPILEGEYLVL